MPYRRAAQANHTTAPPVSTVARTGTAVKTRTSSRYKGWSGGTGQSRQATQKATNNPVTAGTHRACDADFSAGSNVVKRQLPVSALSEGSMWDERRSNRGKTFLKRHRTPSSGSRREESDEKENVVFSKPLSNALLYFTTPAQQMFTQP